METIVEGGAAVLNQVGVEMEVADPDYGDPFEIAPEDEDHPMEFEEPSAVQQRMLQRCHVGPSNEL